MEFHIKIPFTRKEYLYEYIEDYLHRRDKECDLIGAVEKVKMITKMKFMEHIIMLLLLTNTFYLMQSDGQDSSLQHFSEDLHHLKVRGQSLLTQTQQAPRFCIFSNKEIFICVWEFHSVLASSCMGTTRAVKAQCLDEELQVNS